MQRATPKPNEPTTLKILVALGVAATGWALFLWRELLRARAGAEPFCLGDGGGCTQLWDGPFASRVHDLTGLPVAAWGAIWGLVALALPLMLLWRPEGGFLRQRRGAILWTALAGLGGVAVLLGASFRADAFCSNCAVTYIVTALYGAVALRGIVATAGWPLRGMVTALVTTAVAFGALLVPGMRTPKSTASEARAAVVEAAAGIETTSTSPDGSTAPIDPDDAIGQMISSLNPELKQALANVLAEFREAPALPVDPPRALMGPDDAPVRITEFTDIKCGHCATLHETLDYIRGTLGDRFGLDQRYYPLDGHCNEHIGMRGENPESVRCIGARAQICMEDLPTEDRKAFSGALYAQQRTLEVPAILEAATQYKDQMSFDACLRDEATAQKLADDVAFAHRHDPRGTPLVLINGRQGSAFGPFLFAMILADGNPDHPAFASLPEPKPIDHTGHNH